MDDIILKKRNGGALSGAEIAYFVRGCGSGEIPDYQSAALLMAIWFRQMDARETADLTRAIRDSGARVDLSAIDGVKVDKHSTGGVADSTTLIAAPLAAACGVKIAKISGRGLGHTGGTVDKLEAIPGLDPARSVDELVRIVRACGLAVIGQSASLVPADKRLYALRDVTATVDSVALIASSIMSKKLALGSDAIVLDVKCGNGSFMGGLDQARELARMMVAIGEQECRPTVALITDMSQPLGRAVGNGLEVEEAIEVLRGDRDGELKTVSLALAARMLICAGLADSGAEAAARLDRALGSGAGLERLERMIELLGGNPAVCAAPSLLPRAARTRVVTAPRSGYVNEIRTAAVGRCAQLLGAGRAVAEDRVDPAVGLKLAVRLGDLVETGEEIGRLYVNDETHLDRVSDMLRRAIVLGEAREEPPPLIKELIGGSPAEPGGSV